MDVEEKEENHVDRMDVPGADKSDITVNINDRQFEGRGEVDETVETARTQSSAREAPLGRVQAGANAVRSGEGR
jgi:HSP20 family molecular chaperone IbpA